MRALRAFHRAASAAFFMACALLAAGCVSNAPTPHGSVQGAEFGGQELLQSEGNRLAGTAMQANLQSLLFRCLARGRPAGHPPGRHAGS